MSFYSEYPHTRNYDDDLRELIQLYNNLINEYKKLIDIYNDINNNIENILKENIESGKIYLDIDYENETLVFKYGGDL